MDIEQSDPTHPHELFMMTFPPPLSPSPTHSHTDAHARTHTHTPLYPSWTGPTCGPWSAHAGVFTVTAVAKCATTSQSSREMKTANEKLAC